MDPAIKKSHRSKKPSSKKEKKEIKVVYISTPMKVKTSASQFMATVQELTGKDSDIGRFSDAYASGSGDSYLDYSLLSQTRQDYNPQHYNSSSSSYYDSSISSDSSGLEQIEFDDTVAWFDTNLFLHEQSFS